MLVRTAREAHLVGLHEVCMLHNWRCFDFVLCATTSYTGKSMIGTWLVR